MTLQASLIINLFVVSVFAAGFYQPGQPNPDIGLKNAGVRVGTLVRKTCRPFCRAAQHSSRAAEVSAFQLCRLRCQQFSCAA